MTAPQADLGQHLLRDERAIARLVAAARVQPGEAVLDAGAGRGALTRPLADAVGPEGRVWAVEVDPAMVAALRRNLPPQARVLEDDLLQVPLPDPLDAVVANPPFRIVAPLIERIVDARVPRSVLVVPHELAERLVAPPGSERYGKLTVRVRVFARVDNELGFLSRHSFDPPPGVTSSIVRLRTRQDPPDVDVAMLKQVLDAAWPAWKRKAKKAFGPLAQAFRVDSAALTRLLTEKGWMEQVTGTLPPEAFATVASHLQEQTRAKP